MLIRAVDRPGRYGAGAAALARRRVGGGDKEVWLMMSRRRLRHAPVLTVTLLVTLAAAGCGGSGDGAPSASDRPRSDATDRTGDSGGTPAKRPPADPCGLISVQEVQQLGGVSVTAKTSEFNTTGCEYSHDGVLISSTVRGDEAKAFADDMLAGARKKPLSGVGEEAYSYDASDHGTFAVLFRKSGTWVAMTVVADRADNAGRLNELARTVAARI
ncbi:DUF3558 family protein [Streptomyces sp. NPDC058439]|uniref:DUF3558 family protein n=1 Tax=Streptomyces sp. NPDC058439 TaxID=3346500 RepID=UPI00365F38F3